MSQVFVSPAEPRRLRDLGEVSLLTEDYGCDFLIVSHHGIAGVQRKQFPSDFMSSVTDGRLHTLTVKMRTSPLALGVILLEGQPQWSMDGDLIGSYGGNMKRSTLRAMEFSLAASGLPVQWSDSLDDTCQYIETLARWWGKDEHHGFNVRPTPGRANEFGQPTSEREWGIHLLQGFDSIGPQLAERIYDEFDGVPLRWSATKRELLGVHGLGPKRLASLTELVPLEEE